MNASRRIAASKRTFLVLATATLPLGVPASGAFAGQVQQITGFGSNPTGIGMYMYTPSNVSSKPAVLVGIHACHGKGTDVCANGTAFAAQADKYGFLLVCPSAVSSDGCWDVHSNADLTHNGGGDASGIISMVNYVVQNKSGDVNRVFVAGHSSGGMMTNVMQGSYPDIFKAGAAFAGVAFGCFAVGSVDSLGWNSNCANGNVTKAGAQWGDIVRAAYSGFTGTRPRMQVWHGTTDATVNFKNFNEEIKEWTNVLGVGETPTSTENNAIQSSWIRTRYADSGGVVRVEAIQETGQPHNLVVDMADAVHFFGLDGSNPVPVVDGGVPGSGTGGRAGQSGSGGSGGADGGGTGGRAAGSGGGASDARILNGSGGSGGSGGSDGSTGTPSSGGSGAASPSGGSGGSVVVGSGGGGPNLNGSGGGLGTGGASTTAHPDAGSNGGNTGVTGAVANGCSCDAGARGPGTARSNAGVLLMISLATVLRRKQHKSETDGSNL